MYLKAKLNQFPLHKRTSFFDQLLRFRHRTCLEELQVGSSDVEQKKLSAANKRICRQDGNTDTGIDTDTDTDTDTKFDRRP